MCFPKTPPKTQFSYSEKWSLKATGQGSLFDVIGQSLPVAASSVAAHAMENPR
jgi:hypothetical protein